MKKIVTTGLMTALGGIGLLLAPVQSQAIPIDYTISVGGGTWDCQLLRPSGQPCQKPLTGNLTVDSAKTDFADQFVGFSIELLDYLTYTQADQHGGSAGGSFFTFDASGILTGFYLRNFFKPFGEEGPGGNQLVQYYMNLAGGTELNEYRFGDRGDPIILNACTGCVSIQRAIPEPGVFVLMLSALGGLWFALKRTRNHLAAA
jgi:hypothetical protein